MDPEIELKDGSRVEDVRLDRLVEFDERSRGYPVRQLVAGKRRRSYTWRCHATLDQGSEGACVGFGVAHELAARPAEVLALSERFAREMLYWPAQKIDPWPGGAYPEAVPFYEGTSVLAGVKVARKLGYIESFRWAFGLEDLVLGVGYNGPAVLGIIWMRDMYRPDEDGFVHASGRIVGGHCILCRAVNVREEYFTLRNSWGAGWGVGGDCYVTFDDMDYLLRQQGEAVFFLHRHREAQPE